MSFTSYLQPMIIMMTTNIIVKGRTSERAEGGGGTSGRTEFGGTKGSPSGGAVGGSTRGWRSGTDEVK